jgi:hypothetical protein
MEEGKKGHRVDADQGIPRRAHHHLGAEEDRHAVLGAIEAAQNGSLEAARPARSRRRVRRRGPRKSAEAARKYASSSGGQEQIAAGEIADIPTR